MSSSLPISPGTFRLGLLFAFISIHMTYLRLLNTRVPDAYLDEVFHIPQAQSYWSGNFRHWDDKITTPPATYLWSYLLNVLRGRSPGTIGGLGDDGEMLSVEDLRFSNAVLLYVLLVVMYLWVAVARRPVDGAKVLQREFVVMAFPLLWFFSGLYYTDLWSAVSVLATCTIWEAGSRVEVGTKSGVVKKVLFQVLHVLLGLVSLASRQTNVFWVAIFLGGLQAVRTVEATLNMPAAGNGSVLRNPEVNEIWVQDIFLLVLQLIPAALTHLPVLLLDLWPHLTLLASFGVFVVWNGGVVLGDKSNHVATIHTPQLLYIWPCFVFFSWPALLPLLSRLTPPRLYRQLPRLWLAILVLLAMAASVHHNTIVHPFTLADNRHYVFYVFRILMRKWWIKYAGVPVYLVCSWLAVNALSGGGQGHGDEDGTVRLSFVLVWFLSTALSLISAPLVEPRYFIVPWLIWRMHLPEYSTHTVNEDDPKAPVKKLGKTKVMSDQESLPSKILSMLASCSLWIELAWSLLVNYLTCWLFLNRGFEWKQEPGKVQRFMW